MAILLLPYFSNHEWLSLRSNDLCDCNFSTDYSRQFFMRSTLPLFQVPFVRATIEWSSARSVQIFHKPHIFHILPLQLRRAHPSICSITTLSLLICNLSFSISTIMALDIFCPFHKYRATMIQIYEDACLRRQLLSQYVMLVFSNLVMSMRRLPKRGIYLWWRRVTTGKLHNN